MFRSHSDQDLAGVRGYGLPANGGRDCGRRPAGTRQLCRYRYTSSDLRRVWRCGRGEARFPDDLPKGLGWSIARLLSTGRLSARIPPVDTALADAGGRALCLYRRQELSSGIIPGREAANGLVRSARGRAGNDKQLAILQLFRLVLE